MHRLVWTPCRSNKALTVRDSGKFKYRVTQKNPSIRRLALLYEVVPESRHLLTWQRSFRHVSHSVPSPRYMASIKSLRYGAFRNPLCPLKPHHALQMAYPLSSIQRCQAPHSRNSSPHSHHFLQMGASLPTAEGPPLLLLCLLDINL